MPPVDVPAILRVADTLEALQLRRNAAVLRAAVADLLPDEDTDRLAPVQEPPGGIVRTIPWGLHELLWQQYGHDQTAERLAERGGFGRGELGQLAVGMYRGGGRRVGSGAERSYPLLELYHLARAAGGVR